MANNGMVHWHEGLFLQPHHLQTFTRDMLESGWRERKLSRAFPYGVIELKIASDGLENQLVRIDRLKAVMPSGLEVDVPGNCEVPVLDIKRVFANNPGGFTVSLAVPHWSPNRANTVENVGGEGDVRIKRMYRVAETTNPDENTGENPQPMLVRRINARLVCDGDDTTDMELLPLVRIMASAEENTLPRPDPRFIPPCLVIGGSPTLKNMLRDIANAVDAARKELVNQLVRAGFVLDNLKAPQMLMLMRLQTLNRFAARLPTLFAGGVGGEGTISPFDAYLELRELQGELAALSPDRDPFEAPKYDHDQPGVVFPDLEKRIRPLLRSDTKGRYIQVPFIKDGNYLAATMTDEHFQQANGFYIAFKTKMERKQLALLVEDQDKFKLMPKSMIKLNIFGVKLEEDSHQPLELPSSTDLHYYRIDLKQSQKMWERVQQEKSMALRWSELETLDYSDISLYMTVP